MHKTQEIIAMLHKSSAVVIMHYCGYVTIMLIVWGMDLCFKSLKLFTSMVLCLSQVLVGTKIWEGNEKLILLYFTVVLLLQVWM